VVIAGLQIAGCAEFPEHAKERMPSAQVWCCVKRPYIAQILMPGSMVMCKIWRAGTPMSCGRDAGRVCVTLGVWQEKRKHPRSTALI
jgi:hypothetical protein